MRRSSAGSAVLSGEHEVAASPRHQLNCNYSNVSTLLPETQCLHILIHHRTLAQVPGVWVK